MLKSPLLKKYCGGAARVSQGPAACWDGFSANGKTKPSPSGKKTASGNIKQVPDCKPS